MIIYDPRSKFDMSDISLEEFDLVESPQGAYRVLDQMRPDGAYRARCYYETFCIPRPERFTQTYTRKYLHNKLQALAIEWVRRHMVHMEIDGDEVPLEAQEDRCKGLCPLAKLTGRHNKTAEELEWEGIAKKAFDNYRVLLERLRELESSFLPITGYSSSSNINPSFEPNAVPLSLFDLPSVPGSTTPPVVRDEPAFRLRFKDPRYVLRDDSPQMNRLREQVQTRPNRQSPTADAQHYLNAFLPALRRFIPAEMQRKKDV